MGTVARLLIDRLSATVNASREGSFIGIPLHCHILADCFQSHLREFLVTWKQQGSSSDGDVDSSIKIFNQKISKLLENFNVTSLYRLQMEKKLEIYRQEKIDAPNLRHFANEGVNRAMAKLKRDLFKLGIETIVSSEQDAGVLLDLGIIQAPGMARLVLTLEPQVYESLYLTDQAENEKQCWHQAAISGDIENVRYLLETRPEADCIDACFYTAAIHDYRQICQLILRHSITKQLQESQSILTQGRTLPIGTPQNSIKKKRFESF